MPGAPELPAGPPPAGSLRWFAWLFTPSDARATTALLFALDSELRSIVASTVDHAVLHLKLRWWHEEIQRLVQGSPRHPLTQALARLAPGHSAAWVPLTDFLTSLELELAAVAIDDDNELDRFLGLADGLIRTMTLALGADSTRSDLIGIGTDAGQAIRGVQIATDWSNSSLDEYRQAAVIRLAKRSRKRWSQASQAIADSGIEALRGLRVLGQLHIAMLDRLESDRSKRRSRLPAWQSLWTAWHAARQH